MLLPKLAEANPAFSPAYLSCYHSCVATRDFLRELIQLKNNLQEKRKKKSSIISQVCQITLSNLCHSCTNICARVREVAARGQKRWIGTDLCEKMCLPKKRVLNLHYLTIKHTTIKHDPFSVAVQLSKPQHLIGFFKQSMYVRSCG